MNKILLTALVILNLSALSQTGVVRLEFEAAINSDIYQLVPLDHQGFLVFYETSGMAGEGAKNWFFTCFGPDFKEKWKTNIPVILNAEYQHYIFHDSLVYLTFYNPGKVRSGSENFQVTTFDLVNGVSYETKTTLPPDGKPVEFIVAGDKAIVGMNLKNDQAGVFSIILKTGYLNEFTFTWPDQNFIEDLAYDLRNDLIVCLVNNYLSRRQNKLYFAALSTECAFRHDLEIAPVMAGKYLNTGRIVIQDSSRFLILGTYGNVSTKIPSQAEYFGLESAGVYSTRVSGNSQEFMNYYNFAEFNNLRAGVSARDFYRLQKKKERESPEYSMNYELLVHDALIRDSSVIMFMEAFYPEFRTVSDISYDHWGRPVTQSYTVFEGYRFFNALLSAYDADGQLMWDNSLEINSSPTRNLEKKAGYYFDGRPALIFNNDGARISYRICLENTELEPFSKLDLETAEFGDKITAAGKNRMIHWFGYNFLAYGYHTIQNNLLQDKNERTVFYINKISLE